ncbi:YraN family protein [Desulforamulus aquiferis]|uniref:UPF0102 protein P6N53_08275 n=1 Tax=Desulforamulus aquiferis TaxID=1397668 RepID=A0AAW7ZD55_9FIRM|nr:YraN family protein [Desulforamulus aquiferis]MDO7787213.1 YraN family protein [Desulforamulus aquiferis]
MLGRRKKIGSIAEEEAVRYLQELGWKLVQRNYRCRIGEIDIIARDPRGFLVFVEVRSRSGKGYGSPEESVVSRKQHKLRLLANQYLQAHPRDSEGPCRIDVLAVTFEGDSKIINHIINAF